MSDLVRDDDTIIIQMHDGIKHMLKVTRNVQQKVARSRISVNAIIGAAYGDIYEVIVHPWKFFMCYTCISVSWRWLRCKYHYRWHSISPILTRLAYYCHTALSYVVVDHCRYLTSENCRNLKVVN